MNAYVHDGHTLTVPAPYEVNGGDGVQVGAIFGVARTWSKGGEPVEIKCNGVFDLGKSPEEIWGIGDKLYWDAVARRMTKMSTGNALVGVAVEAAKGDGETHGRVRIGAVPVA